MVTSDKWTLEFSKRRKVLTGNVKTDNAIIAEMRKDDPLAAQVLQTQLEDTNKLTGNWRIAVDSRVKEAFYPELQNALLGRKTAKEALDEAERKVNRALARQ